MKVDIEKLDQITKSADGIFLEPEAEQVLLDLLEIEKQLEDAKEAVKAKLEKAALELDPNFSSIQSDRVRVYYRQYGHKYSIDESLVDQLPESLYKRNIKYSANSDEVDKWAEEHGGLPNGIIKNERPKSISISEI